MKKRRKKKKAIDFHVYGVFDVVNEKLLKVSLDRDEIHMEMALIGATPETFIECTFEVRLGL